jgi:UDP-N-acetylglucosamine 2-epimerase (non-hydrolysing)
MTKLKVACIFGTRPELIKMALLINALKDDQAHFEVESICTGQHKELLDPLIDWFGLTIHRNLDVMRPGQGLNDLLGRLITEFGKLFSEKKYDYVIGQGDTVSVVAAAFAAFYENIPFVHVEAGLRTFDRNLPYPEEMNRVLVGRLATIHFAPTETAATNLRNEGVPAENLFMVGNSVIDALQYTAKRIGNDSSENHSEKKLIFVTTHRRENFGEPLNQICNAIRRIAEEFSDVEIVFPVHPNPNVRNIVFEALGDIKNIQLIDPVPYEKLVSYLQRSYLVLTDSGGLQEEAPALSKPVLVLREETERPELVELGGSILVGSDESRIFENVYRLLTDVDAYRSMVIGYSPYGDGKACERMAIILSNIGKRS